jgi:pyruvate dehydrogenase E1 component beta subunit
MPVIEFREALRTAMIEEMERDDRVFLIGEEVAQYDGAYKVSRGMLQKFGPQRVVDAPISETAFAGLGIGAATCGLRPIVEFMSWSFTLVCLDQLMNNAANIRYMSGGQIKIPIVFRGVNGIAHQLGATHSHRVQAMYSRVPGLVVVAPSSPYEAKGLLKSAIRCDDPVIFLESEKILADKGEVPDEEYLLPLGVANVERTGSDVTILSYGRPLTRIVRQATEVLVKDHGIDVELIDVRSLRPLDLATILASVRKTHRCVIIDEDWGYCGMGAGILHQIHKPAFDDLDAPIEYIHADDIPVPFSHDLELAMLPSLDGIVSTVNEMFGR